MEIKDFVNMMCVHIYYLKMLTAYEDIENKLFILKISLKY